jgi:sarcosine oxidase subunit alpha
MGLVLNGPDRMNEVIEFTNPGGAFIPAKIVPTIFYDPEGKKQNV